MSAHSPFFAFLSFFVRSLTFFVRAGVDLNSMDPDTFAELMTRFLFSPAGARFRFLFRYETPIQCGKPAPDLTVSERQGCQIFLGTTYQNGEKIHQITMKYTKCPQNISTGRKIDQMVIKYTNILHYIQDHLKFTQIGSLG
jgi:hypothetical protein